MSSVPVYPPLPEALKAIAALSPQAFEALRADVASAQAYTFSQKRCKALADILGLQYKQVYVVLSSVNFLYERFREWRGDDDKTEDVVREFLDATGLGDQLGGNLEEGTKRLVALTVEHPEVERSRKVRWLRTGILDTAVEFSSFVEIRPRFSRDRQRIEELVPMVLFRVGVESDGNDAKSHVFQLSPKGLGKLKEAIADVEKKMTALSADERFRPSLIDDPVSPPVESAE
jgi:hypothetical protein